MEVSGFGGVGECRHDSFVELVHSPERTTGFAMRAERQLAEVAGRFKFALLDGHKPEVHPGLGQPDRPALTARDRQALGDDSLGVLSGPVRSRKPCPTGGRVERELGGVKDEVVLGM